MLGKVLYHPAKTPAQSKLFCKKMWSHCVALASLKLTMQSNLASNSLRYIHASVPLIYALVLASISVQTYPTETLDVKPNTFFLFLNSMLSGYTTLSLHNSYYYDFKIFFPLFLSKLTAIGLASSSVVKTTCLAFTKSQSDPQHIKTKRNGKSKTMFKKKVNK